jgi:tetratricopeptide (TPR) repeat protein
MLRRLVPWLLLWMIALAGAHAHAQAKPADYEAAKQHYLAAKDAMGKKDYDGAVQEYLAAYEITKDPSLFKQVAQAYEQAGKKPEAVTYLRRYLTDAKNPPDADAVKKKIEELEPGAASMPAETQPASQPAVPAPETTPPNFLDEGPSWKRTAAWVSVGLAAVFLTTGSVLATSAQSRQQDLQRLIDFRDPSTGLPKVYTGTVAQDYQDKADEGEKLNTYALVAFIGAGVAVGAAAVLFVLDAKSGRKAPAAPERAATITPYVAPGGAGVVAGWTF